MRHVNLIGKLHLLRIQLTGAHATVNCPARSQRTTAVVGTKGLHAMTSHLEMTALLVKMTNIAETTTGTAVMMTVTGATKLRIAALESLGEEKRKSHQAEHAHLIPSKTSMAAERLTRISSSTFRSSTAERTRTVQRA